MNLPSNPKRNLTDKQQDFLNNLIETKGNLKLSAELAGYAGNHYQVINSLRQEIVDLASTVLAREAPKAAFKLVEVMESDAGVNIFAMNEHEAELIANEQGVTIVGEIVSVSFKPEYSDYLTQVEEVHNEPHVLH